MPLDHAWLWIMWTPRFDPPTYLKKLSVVRPKQCIPIMCERSAGGAYWCNDSDATKTKLWRELAEAAGEVFSQCGIGICSSGQVQVDQDSRIIVTHPLGQGCNMRYDVTLEMRGPYEGIWPKDLDDPWYARVDRNKQEFAPPPIAKMPVPSSNLLSEVSRPSGFECSSIIGRPPTFSHARQLFDGIMDEYIGGKNCTLGPKQCMNVGCRGDTVAFFWCNDSMETRIKPCYEPVDKAWVVITQCKGGGYGKYATTGGTYHDGDERVFVVRPIDGRCELEYERTERKFADD